MTTRWICALASILVVAPAGAAETRTCKYEASDCISGEATATLVDGRLTKIEVGVFYCGQPGTPGYSCTLSSKRGDGDYEWSDATRATTVTNRNPFNADKPDEAVVTVGKNVSIDLSNAQSAGNCGAGAELPKAIVIPDGGGACKVFD